MPRSALTPQAAVDRLGETSAEVRAAILLDERGRLAAQAGAEDAAGGLRDLTGELFQAAEAAGTRAGLDSVRRIEVSRPEGGVFGVHDLDSSDRPWTLVAITAGGALSSLVHYDMRMALRSIGTGS